MSYKDPSYVIFDGDNDKWAYGYMKGLKQNDRVDFDFRDAHDLLPPAPERISDFRLARRFHKT
ncbi:MAG: hypothetical protein WAU59_14485 [Rhodoplanes sp.]|jgi:hypothetical protein